MKRIKKVAALCFALFLCILMTAPEILAQNAKFGYVDLRRCFYEYKKKQSFDKEMETFTAEKKGTRDKLVEEVKKLQSEVEMANDKSKAKKQADLDAKITQLNDLDKQVRQDILNKQNEMFRLIIEDIQKIVDNIGKTENYSYIFDTRAFAYANKQDDLTDRVIAELNK